MPVRIVAAPGHRGDVLEGRALINGLTAGHFITDMTYDAGHFRDAIAAAGATATIPSHPDRSRRVPCDWRMYRERNLVERLIGRLKQFRRGVPLAPIVKSSLLPKVFCLIIAAKECE